MAFRRWLPLDHDGLVGPAAGDDILWRSRGGLLGQGNPGPKNKSGWAFPLGFWGKYRGFMGYEKAKSCPVLSTRDSAHLLCASG